MSLVNCPVCGSKSRVAASGQITNETREQYNQCLNIHCSVTFVTLTSLVRIIKSPKEGSEIPNAAIQPELARNANQMDFLQHNTL